MKRLTRSIVAAALGAAALATTVAAHAAYPEKLIRMVVAFPAGGDTDALARLYAEHMSKKLGQNVVVENRPGAGGSIGTQAVARAKPDGYTLMFVPNTHPIVPHVLPSGVKYDAVKDFEPVIMTGSSPFVIVASKQSGLATVQALAKQQQQGQPLSYGTPGFGSPMHVVGEIFAHDVRLKLDAVHYQGNAPLITDLLGGHVPLAVSTPGATYQHAKAGTLVPLAVTTSERSPVLPDVPTTAEAGHPIDLAAWWGVFAPKGTPAPVIDKLNSVLNEVLQEEVVLKTMSDLGATPVGGTAKEFGERNASDFQLYESTTKQFGISAAK